MAIPADTKDWIWVLDRRCPECGFDTRTITGPDVAPMLRANASAWVGALAGRPEPAVRPADDRWSVLEYACHVRDVFLRFDERLHLMLDRDDPAFPNWDQDATAIEKRYRSQDPATVAVELQAAAAALADGFEHVGGAGGPAWNRTGTRSDGARFSVETLARYLMHDPVHHLHDIGATGEPAPR